ncbi:DUF1350 family protein [Geitlerinema sp. PCC 9228]|jgi:hypothetical protein|uniref:DUF1350 family protein n=1 Tax=Geitlerinema sp. PCC 9228 TaxID=111611 RepID=UPI0008F9A27D|nr:DUF1350 family protein [Geitlerinema sp. PCC 9228]
MEWKDIRGNWVLAPPQPNQPKGIIHFLGGAFIAAAPNETYKFLLEELAQAGYVVIATSFLISYDHRDIAQEIYTKYNLAMEELRRTNLLRRRYVPIYGIGHSLGCKMHLMLNSMFSVERDGNIFLAYNNYSAKKSIPNLDVLLDQISPFVESFIDLDLEFTPSPEATLELVRDRYRVKRNFLVKFQNDDIDETMRLKPILQEKFPHLFAIQMLPGNHLTPLGQNLQWPVSEEFSPLDALGQWVKQNLYKDFYRLRDEILLWLDPARSLTRS